MSSQDGTSTLIQIKGKGEGEEQMWGHSSTWEDEEGAGCPLRARAASVMPQGCVLCLAPHGSGQGGATIHGDRGRRGAGEATQTFGTRCHSRGNLRVLGCGHMWRFKGQIAGYRGTTCSPKPQRRGSKPLCLHATSGVGCGKSSSV